VRRVVVDANVFLSFIVHRNDKQRDAAKALLAKAEDGELVVILPQFVKLANRRESFGLTVYF
jgi:predicted nucleic acid-binding protein